MAHRTFISLHYARDLARANIVRGSEMIDGVAAAGWDDASRWEQAKEKGDAAIHRMIDAALEQTTATVICIGSETAQRTYIDYEIRKSAERGNVLLGVRINGVTDHLGQADPPGDVPFRLKALDVPVFAFASADELGKRIERAVQTRNGSRMKCLRIYADESGESHLADIEIPLRQSELPAGGPACSVSARYPATGVQFVTRPPGNGGLGWHNPPERQLVVWLTGTSEFETSDGNVRRVGPGSIVLIEDVSGKGHVSRHPDEEQRLMTVPVPAGI